MQSTSIEGADDGLDPLPHPGQVAEPALFVLAVGAGQQHVDLVGRVAFHLQAGQALVRQDDHLVAQRPDVTGMAEQVGGHVALAELGVGQAPGDRHALGGGEQVQLQAPVPAEWAAQ
jgi:hypothetical protein